MGGFSAQSGGTGAKDELRRLLSRRDPGLAATP